MGGLVPSGDLVPGDHSPLALFVLTEEGCVHLAVLQDSLKHPATPIRGFPLAVSFGLKSWALSKVPASLE